MKSTKIQIRGLLFDKAALLTKKHHVLIVFISEENKIEIENCCYLILNNFLANDIRHTSKGTFHNYYKEYHFLSFEKNSVFECEFNN